MTNQPKPANQALRILSQCRTGMLDWIECERYKNEVGVYLLQLKMNVDTLMSPVILESYEIPRNVLNAKACFDRDFSLRLNELETTYNMFKHKKGLIDETDNALYVTVSGDLGRVMGMITDTLVPNVGIISNFIANLEIAAAAAMKVVNSPEGGSNV